MTFRYGLYLNPQPSDRTEEYLEAAKKKADKMSRDNRGAPTAVWNEKDSTVALFAGYEEFSPTRLLYG